MSWPRAFKTYPLALNSESARMAAATLVSPSRLAAMTSCTGEGGGIGVADVVGRSVPGQAGIARRVGLVDLRRAPAVAGGIAARTEQQDEKDKSRSHAEPRFD